MSFGPSTALHPPAHIHKYALADAPCIRTKIRRNLAHLFLAETLSRYTPSCLIFLKMKQTIAYLKEVFQRLESRQGEGYFVFRFKIRNITKTHGTDFLPMYYR